MPLNDSAYKRLAEIEADLQKFLESEKLCDKYKCAPSTVRYNIEQRIKQEKEYIRQFENDLANMRFVNE